MIRRPPRSGFTLLEIILALAIGLVLMTALYVMLASQLAQSEAGRDSIQEATLARAVLARISNDIAGSLGPYDPRMVSAAPSEGEEGEEGAMASTTTTTSTASATFNVGVRGDTRQLMLAVGRVPRELFSPDKLRVSSSGLPKVSDLRRISYWVIEGKGLARQEVVRVTSDEIDSDLPDASQAERLIIAPEVKAISFQYWNGEGSWEPDWDGSTPGADGDTPVGAPAAIEIIIELERSKDRERGKYRHVVSIPTGNNYSLQQAQ